MRWVEDTFASPFSVISKSVPSVSFRWSVPDNQFMLYFPVSSGVGDGVRVTLPVVIMSSKIFAWTILYQQEGFRLKDAVNTNFVDRYCEFAVPC